VIVAVTSGGTGDGTHKKHSNSSGKRKQIGTITAAAVDNND
jgi:hypothetical protein